MAATVVDYKFIARHNRSLSSKGIATAVAALACLPLTIAIAFSVAGAWLVFPFAGLEILAVAIAFHLNLRHADDFECITIEGDQLAIEKKYHKCTTRAVFHRYWAQIVLRTMPGGDQRLWLRSHGKEVEVGRYLLNNEQRRTLAQQLQERIGQHSNVAF